MKIAVMGAGAVGCYYGAMLAQAGHDVTLIGRAQHVEAIRAQGLLLEKQGAIAAMPVRASTEPDALQGAQAILFCVKSADTETAGEAIAPHLMPGSFILSLQNGVDNAERLQRVLQRIVIPAVVYVGCEMAGPGHVRHHGRGELVLGAAPESDDLAAMFSKAGIPAAVSDNVIGALWTKLIINCAYNALSAITQRPYGILAAAPGMAAVIKDAVEECLAITHKRGIAIPGDIWRSVSEIAQTMPAQYSSTAQDLARGRPSEIDYLNGYVARKGDELGIPTPVNRVLSALVKCLETRPMP